MKQSPVRRKNSPRRSIPPLAEGSLKGWQRESRERVRQRLFTKSKRAGLLVEES